MPHDLATRGSANRRGQSCRKSPAVVAMTWQPDLVDGTLAADARLGSPTPQLEIAVTAVQILSALAVIASAAWLPWATYQQSGSRVTHDLHAASFASVLFALAALVLALAAMYAARPRRILAAANVGCAAALLVVAGLAGATRIAHANSLTINAGGTTRFGIGLGVACLAAIAIGASAAVEVTRRTPDRSSPPSR
jgi:hypothetical protein